MKANKLLEKPPTLKKHPALKTIRHLCTFFFLVGHFCPLGFRSGSNGSKSTRIILNPSSKEFVCLGWRTL